MIPSPFSLLSQLKSRFWQSAISKYIKYSFANKFTFIFFCILSWLNCYKKRRRQWSPFTGSIVCVFIPMDLLCIIADFIFSVKQFFERLLHYSNVFAVIFPGFLRFLHYFERFDKLLLYQHDGHPSSGQLLSRRHLQNCPPLSGSAPALP